MSFAPSAYPGSPERRSRNIVIGLWIETGAGSLIEIKALICKR
jgi:hypothetical protein